MKYSTLLTVLMVTNVGAQDGEKPKTPPLIFYFSSNTVTNSSSTIDGHEINKQPIIYRVPPQEYHQPQPIQVPVQTPQPTPMTPIATMPQAPIMQQPLPQELVAPITAALPPPTIRTPDMQNASATTSPTNPAWQLPSMNDLLTSIKNTACSINPYTITAGALVALYATYLVKLYNTSYRVMKKNTWATWKEHIPVEVMLEVPHQEVAEELFNAIKAKYLPVHSADLMTPIVKFNNSVDLELAQLNQFIRIHEWLNYTKLGYIFPKQEMEIVHAHTKIKRLVFLKDVLLAWMSDYSSAIMHDKFIPRFQQQRVQQTQPEYVTIVSTSTIECI